MNPFKINQILTFNIYALNGYVSLILILLLYNHRYSLYFFEIFILYVLISHIIFVIVFIVEIIINKKILWKFNVEYSNNLFAKSYFLFSLILNICFYCFLYVEIIRPILIFVYWN